MGAFIDQFEKIKASTELLCREDYIFVSVSQGSTFDDKGGKGKSGCNRKWGFDKIDRIPRPENPVLEFGKRGHSIAERWIKKGTPPPDTPEGNTFKLGIKKDWLPAPKTRGIYTEEVFARIMHEIADDLCFIGYIDIVDVRDPLHAIVIDHKFTKDLRYAMDEADLRADLQAIGYARILFDETEAQRVTCRWIYYCAVQPKPKEGQPLKPRKPKAAKKVEITFERGDAFNKKWERFVEVARGIHTAKNTVTSAHELPANALCCESYGGCPFAKDDPATDEPYCKRSDEDVFRSHWAQFEKTNKRKGAAMGGLFDKIKKREAESAAEAAALGATPTEETPAAASSGGLDGAIDKMAAGNKVPLKGEAKVTPQGRAGGLNAAMDAGKNDGINPPEQHQPDSGEADPTPETDAEKKKRETAEKRAAKKAEKDAAAAAAGAATAPTQVGMTVFIDCLPVKGIHPTVQLVDILAPSMVVVMKKIDQPHWNMAEYSGGAALLAVAFDEWLDANPQSGVIVVDGSTAESRAVREVLISHAKHVVRGF